MNIWSALGISNPFDQPEFAVAFAVILIYTFFWLISRWHNVASPTHRKLLTQIAGVENHLDSAVSSPNDFQRAQIDGLRESLREARKGVETWAFGLNFFLWSRGGEIAGWRRVHEVERRLVEFYESEQVAAQLVTIKNSLQNISTAEARGIATAIDALNLPDMNITAREFVRYKNLLQDALRVRYDYLDTGYTRLVTWHNKAAWLMAVSLLFIIVIVAILPGTAIILFAGAVGGLLSRLVRSVRNRQAFPTDYGAFWTSFYLAPVTGALAAWTGILLIVFLAQINVLGDAFDKFGWENVIAQAYTVESSTSVTPSTPDVQGRDGAALASSGTTSSNGTSTENGLLLTLGLAILLGFSERLLSNFLEGAEGAFSSGTAESQTNPGEGSAP